MQVKNNILQFGRNKSTAVSPDTSNQANNLQSNIGNSNFGSSSLVKKVSMTAQGPLRDIAHYTSQWTSDSIAALFDNVDTQLFEMAEKSERAAEQNTYFDAMRIVRLRKSQVHDAFNNNIHHAFNHASMHENKQQEEVTSDIDNLSLINDDSLEEDLATHGMIAKAERDNRDLLTQLNQRIACLYQGIDIHNENNPLAPTSLCNAFAAAVESLEADIKVKLLVFKLFDINIVAKLNELYEHINKLLIEQDILPELKISYKQTADRKTVHPANQGTNTGLPINTPVSDTFQIEPSTPVNQAPADQVAVSANDTEAYILLQQLVAQNKHDSQPGMSNPVPVDFASTSDISKSLQQMQVDSVNYNLQNGMTTSALLKEALKQSLQANHHNQTINQQDDDLIDVIGMLFDFILNDENLVDSVKSLISRLQIPVIKIALQDKSFFSNKSHPARKFLNDLANIGLGVTDDLPSRDNPLYLKLEHLINRVLNEMTDSSDPSLFVELLDDLERFTLQFNQGRKKSSLPSQAAAIELIKTELDSRQADKPVPHTITLLLERVWKDVMLDIFFNEGMDSDEWDMALTFIDTLIWSIDPKADIQSQKQLVRVIPGILKALNAGLDKIEYPKELRKQLLLDLQNCHLACLKGQSIDEKLLSHDDSVYLSNQLNPDQEIQPAELMSNLESTAGEPFAVDSSVDDFLFEEDLNTLTALDEEDLLASLKDGSDEAIADHGEDELIEDSYTQQARSLTSGSWVDFYGPDNGITHRAKISWKSEDASAFIFVTQTGQIAEKSLAGLSAALRTQQAKVLDESPVFERAMEAMLDNLQ